MLLLQMTNVEMDKNMSKLCSKNYENLINKMKYRCKRIL
jgi:hypothetical protein